MVKHKVHLISFAAENPKAKDVAAFRKLWVKLGVKIDCVIGDYKLKGQTADVMIVDEIDYCGVIENG